mgnify:FL=1
MNQPKAIPHPNDADKWMSSFDSYGHGPGNGKSRNAIYKRFKKVHGPDSVKSTPSKKEATESLKNKSDFNDKSTTFEQARSTAVLENVEKSLQEPENPPENQEPDSVKWGSIEWDEPEIDAEVKTSTIPKPLSEMAQGQRMAFNQESQAQMIRVGFRALDRALTHYGRGVMNSKDWSVDRSESDYDALEGATSAVFEHYGVQVPVSPLLVLGVTLSTAYLPPLNHIRKNADPNRKGGRILGVFRRLIPKRFRKAKPVRGEPDEPILE